MTKIKNTKKGMAKKTLSMSLVVAMLATSNVPVWAAEFSDGSDVSVETEAPTAEEFSDATEAAQVADDAETPAIEDNTESVAVATAASDFNLTGITVNEKAKNPTWDEKGDTTTGKVAFTSQIFSGSIGGFANNKLQYAWAYNGTFSETDLTPMSAATVNSVTMPEASVLKAHVGETISLLFVETGTTTPIAKIELGTVQKVDISKTGFALNAITGETYNGAKHEPVITDASFATAPGGVTTYQVNGQETLNKAANYTWGYAGTDGLVNAKSKVTVTGTYVGVDADKYTGTMTTTFEIDKLALNATGNDFIIKAATPGKEFSYTGNTTQEVDKSEVNVYLADAKDKSVASDVLLNDFVKKVTLDTSSVSAAKNDKVFTVTFDTDKISQSSNFKLANNVAEVKETSKAKYGSSSENNNGVNVVALDLAGVTATLKNPLAKQAEGITSPSITANQLKFVKDGKTLDIAGANLAITVTPADYSKTGTYYKAITITGKGGAKGTIYADLEISDKAFASNCNFVGNTGSNIFLSKDSAGTGINKTLKYNNGKAVEFSKDQLATLGDFCPDGNFAKGGDQTNFQITYDNNVNASGTKLAKLTVTAIAGEYKGCSQDFYFKIDPSQVVPAADKTTTVTTNAKKYVPGVAFNEANKKASDYAEAIGLKVTGTNGATTEDKKVVSTATADDYTVKYTYVTDTNGANESETTGNEIKNYVQAVITLKKDGNFATPSSTKTGTLYDSTGVSFKTTAPSSTDRGTITLYVPILKESIESLDVSLDQTSYTYTGAEIEPKVSVKLNGKAIDASEYKVKVNNGINVGTAEVVVEMNSKSDYQGSKTLTATITPAKISDLKFVIKDTNKQYYNGKQKKPVVGTDADIKLGKVSLNDMFDVAYGKNIDAGKEAGTVTLTPKAVAAKNFDGSSVTTTFDIERRNLVNGSAWAIKLTNDDGLILDKNALPALEWTGKEVEFANSSVILNNLSEVGGQGTNVKSNKDYTYKVAYANNVDPTNDAKNAYVCLVGTGNYTGAYQIVKNTTNGAVACLAKSYVENSNKTIPGMFEVLVDDVINGSYATFDITGAKTFSAKNVTITNATYAGGVTVKPGSVVKDPKTGAVLTEGKDYELVFDSKKVDVTSTPIEVEVKGLGQYKGTSVKTKTDGKKLTFIIEKKDLKDCSVSVDKNLKLTVMNGNVLETKENFTVKDNGDGTATVSVVDGGKNYTGSVNVEIGGRKVGAPMISNVKVVGNKATVILSDDVESASGYDYVISTDKDCITNKDYAAVNKNQAKTTTAFKYVDKGTYYAYCHAWTRDANGKKVFGEWSNGFQFSVTATTPDAPVITNVKVSGSTIKVTYRPAANATGYDVVLGTSSKKDNGELRPYNYGAHKKLNLKEGTVTATFKNVPKGTWTVGMHAFNRTSIDNKKVFSPWSNLETAKVK